MTLAPIDEMVLHSFTLHQLCTKS